MAQRIRERIQDVQSTTDAATTVTIANYTVPANASFYAECVYVGRDTTTGDTVSGRIAARFTRIAGVLAIVGTTLTLVALGGSAALATVLVVMDASGDAVRVRANGVIAKTIEFQSDLQIWIN